MMNKRYRIALCDDMAILCHYFSTLLNNAADEENIRVKVDKYGSGEAILEAFQAGKIYDLYFIDLHLGGISGMETLRELRKLGVKQPILMMSAGIEEKKLNHASGFIDKEKVDNELFKDVLRINLVNKEQSKRQEANPIYIGNYRIDLGKVERINGHRVYLKDARYQKFIELKDEELNELKMAIAGYILDRR